MVGPQTIAAEFPGLRMSNTSSNAATNELGDIARRRVTQFLSELEHKHRLIILDCGPTDTDDDGWASIAVSQADLILIIAKSNSSPVVGPQERALCWHKNGRSYAPPPPACVRARSYSIH